MTRRLISFLAFLALSMQVMANDVPGLPTPTFCVSDSQPQLPQGWPTDAAEGFYYVDNSHDDATDLFNSYGSKDRPRSSMPTGDLAAGTYIELHGGPYKPRQNKFMAYGTAEKPIWIRGADKASPVRILNHWSFDGAHITLENLQFEGSRTGVGLYGTQYACVRNNHFLGPGRQDGNSAVVSISGISEIPASFNVVANNVISGFGAVDTEKENDYHGVFPVQYASYTWILNNKIFDNGGDGIQVGRTNLNDDSRPSYVFIGGNEIYGNRENAVDIKRAADIVISANLMYDYAGTSSSSGEAVVIHSEPDRVWVLHNIVFNSVYGVVTTGSADTWVINNVIYDIHHTGTDWKPTSAYAPGAAIHFRGSSSGGVIGNTVAYSDTGIQITQGLSDGYQVVNNIFALRSESKGYDFVAGSGGFIENSNISHNLFYSLDSETRIHWRGRHYDSIQSAAGASGQFAQSANADPGFNNSSQRVFSVGSESIANSSATPVSIGSVYCERYKVEIGLDYARCEPADNVSAVLGARVLIPTEATR